MPRHPAHSSSAGELSDRVYGALVDEARKRGGTIHYLNVGDTYLDPLPRARAEAQNVSEHRRLHNYAPVNGEPVLVDAIIEHVSKRHGVTLAPDAIQVMAGATGGFTVVASALFDPGDEVVVLAPFWPLIRGIVRSRGATAVEVSFYDRLSDPGFDVEGALEAAITQRTVALYLNSPSNPTGRVIPVAAVDAISRVVTRHGLWLLTDEAYEELWYTPEPPKAIWARPELAPYAIASHTLSKSHALAGARIGYTHGPAEVMRTIRGVQTFLTYCAPRPMQMGAARALREGGDWLAEARRLYAEAGQRAAAALNLPAPEGGTFLFFDAKPWFRQGEGVHDFLRRCLDVGVLLTPGSASGTSYGSWVRLCYTVVPPAELDDALARLGRVLG
jgi:N-succinyldiaminopimelate aminotransferase